MKRHIDAAQQNDAPATAETTDKVGRKPVFQQIYGLGIVPQTNDAQDSYSVYSPSFRQSQYRSWRQQIADLEDDVDAFLSQYSADDLLNPNWAAKAAKRLTAAGRTIEAQDILTKSRDDENHRYIPHEWDLAFVETLKALDQTQELHDFRWQKFTETLSVDYLRDLLKALPDFEDVEAEDLAKTFALKHDNFSSALSFFLEWPDHRLAAELVYSRSEELNGDAYYSLTPAADQLQGEFPLAAVLCRRAMISYTLDKAKSTRYKHAIRHFQECQSADSQIESYQSFLRHDEFERHLKAKHPRKEGFWRGVV